MRVLEKTCFLIFSQMNKLVQYNIFYVTNFCQSLFVINLKPKDSNIKLCKVAAIDSINITLMGNCTKL